LVTEYKCGGGVSLPFVENIVAGFTDNALHCGRIIAHGDILIHSDIVTTHARAAKSSQNLSVPYAVQRANRVELDRFSFPAVFVKVN
jgi:hypothetical protein